MRSQPRPKNEKSNNKRYKVAKKKRPSWNYRNKIAIESLANINKSFRSHKSRSEGNWDLVPKDSCEVYKERRRRQTEKKQAKLDSSASEESYRTKEKVPKKVDKINRKKKRSNVKPRRKRRARSDSSVPSYTCSDTSMGSSRATEASSSDDYDD